LADKGASAAASAPAAAMFFSDPMDFIPERAV
jgi:hypothetical protein